MKWGYILIAIALGIMLGTYFSARKHMKGGAKSYAKTGTNKQKILSFLNQNKQATNDDIQKLLNVSDATATRYLDQLEKQNKITQVGDTGSGVFYKLK